MPQAIAYIGAYLMLETSAMALGAFLLSNAAVIGTAAMLIGGLAYSSYKSRQAKEQARQQYNAAQMDRMANVVSTVAPRDLVLGRVRKAGAVFYRASTGANSQDLYLAIALAGHELDAIETIYLNDVAVSLDGAGYVTTAPYQSTATLTANGDGLSPTLPPNYVPGTLVTGTYGESSVERYSYQYTETTSHVRITKYLGAPGQAADPDLLAAFPSDWSANNTVAGVAYLVVRLKYSEAAFPSGVPNISAVVRGAKLYDPRSSLTAWSENPALMMRHVYAHPKLGKATVSAAEDARFAAAANACDTSTVYTVAGVAQPARALYQAALAAPFGSPAKDLLDDLAQAMGGSWAFAGGEFYLKPGSYSAPVMSLGDADLAVIQRNGASESQRPISIAVHKERAAKLNTLKPKIWDAAQDYKEVQLTPLASTALMARDGVELAQEVTMAAVGYAPQALHIAGIILRDARDPLVVELPFKLRAYPLELFDTVDLTLSRYGWTAKTFMVLGRSWSADGSISLTLKETSAAIVTMDAGFAAQGFASNTNLPSPWSVQGVSGLTVGSGTAELVRQLDGTVISRMRISWPQHGDIAVRQAGQIEVQYRNITSSGAWASLVVAGDETQVVTSEVADGETYQVRARARSAVTVSDWCSPVLHQVIGKTAPPATPSNVVVSREAVAWTPVTDADLAGYVLRAIPGAVANWGSGIALHTGVVTASPFSLANTRLYGVQTLMVAAIDTSGNLSGVVSAVYDFASASLTNLVDSYDYAANLYPGAVSGGAYSAGALRASAASTSDLYPLDELYGQADVYATSWQTLVYTSTAFAARYGGLVSLNAATSGSATLEYQLDGGSADSYALADTYASVDLYGSSNWAPWPGAVQVQRMQGLRWRITVAGGTAQGLISALSASHTMTGVRQTFAVRALAAGGSRLSPGAGSPAYSAWLQIQTVQATPVADGSGAVTAQVLEINPTAGPVVQLLNAAGASVAGTATIDIGGLVDD